MATMPPSRVRKRVPKGRVFESEAPMQQQHFPHRRNIARVNHNPPQGTRRRDAGKVTKTASQQTLTQIDFVHTTPMVHDDSEIGIDWQEQAEGEWEESRPAKRRRKTNFRQIPKLAGQDTLTQLDFVKVSRQPADVTDYDVWLETPNEDPKADEVGSIKEECLDDNNQPPVEITPPTNYSVKRRDVPEKVKTLRKIVRRKGEPGLSPVSIPTHTALKSDVAPRSPLSDLSPNKPSPKSSPIEKQNKKHKKKSPKKRTTTIRESLSLTPPQITKRKQILAVANSDSEDIDESSDNDDSYQSKNSTVIIKVQSHLPYPANELSSPNAENHTHECRSPPPSSSPTPLTVTIPPAKAAFTQEEILDSESARAASSQTGDVVKLEESSPATYQINSIANTISEACEAHTHSEVPRDKQGHHEDSNDHNPLAVSVSRNPPETRKKRPQKQDPEQHHSILPTPLSQATTVDPDTPNTSSVRSLRSMQLPASSLRQESSLDQQEQEKGKQQEQQQQQRYEIGQYGHAQSSTIVSDDNFEHDICGYKDRTDEGRDWNATYDLDEGGTSGYGSYSLPSSPVDVVTAENLLPESLMAFSIPPPPSYSRML